jgi:hypothetical protein
MPSVKPACENETTDAARITCLMREVASLKAELSKGVVVFTQEKQCPRGFIELTALRGRYVVGLPTGGEPNGAIGRPLGPQERRNVVAYHDHAIDPNQLQHVHSSGTDHLGWDGASHQVPGGTGYNLQVRDKTGQAEFVRGQPGNEIKTYATGLNPQVDDIAVNAPYLQLLACVHG